MGSRETLGFSRYDASYHLSQKHYKHILDSPLFNSFISTKVKKPMGQTTQETKTEDFFLDFDKTVQ